MIAFGVTLMCSLFAIIYHSFSHSPTKTINQITTITKLPVLSLCVGVHERRLPPYETPKNLYPDIESIDYLGFVYDK